MSRMPPDPRSAEYQSADSRVDAALRRAFAPPPLTAAIAEVHARAARSELRRGRRRPLLVLAIAAAVILAFLLRPAPEPPARASDAAAMSGLWVAAYHHAVERGFDTPQCCDSSCDLRSKCHDLFGARLDVAAAIGVDMCGAYCGPAGGAAALLARWGEEPVCLFVLPRARAPAIASGDLAGLRLYRREVGDLVVFELSRLPLPRVLPQVFVPQR